MAAAGDISAAFDEERHHFFLTMMLDALPAEYQGQEINTLTLAYFDLSSNSSAFLVFFQCLFRCGVDKVCCLVGIVVRWIEIRWWIGCCPSSAIQGMHLIWEVVSFMGFVVQRVHSFVEKMDRTGCLISVT